MLSHERHEENGISSLADYYQRSDMALSVERYFDSESLEEAVAKSPLEVERFQEVFSKILDSVAYLISERGVYHRDLKPSNILLGKSRQKNKTRITDLANACEIKDAQPKVRPTAGGHFVMDPLLLSQFTGDVNSYNEQAEIYALGVDMYYALTGKYLFEFDPDLGTAKVVETGENLLNLEGRLDQNKYRVTLSKALRELPKDKRRFTSILEKCLVLNPKERYDNISFLNDDFKKAVKPRLFERMFNNPLLMGLIALGTLTIGGQQLGYYALNNKAEKLEQKVEEASKQLRIDSEWSSMDLEIGNNLFELKIRAEKYWKEGDKIKTEIYPEVKYLSAHPGEEVHLTINLNEFGRFRTEGGPSSIQPFNVRYYLEGFEGKEVSIYTLSFDKGDLLEPEAGMAYISNNQQLKIPENLPLGNYNLVVEVYAPIPPTEAEKENHKNVIYEKNNLIFNKPGNVLARKIMPLVVKSDLIPEQFISPLSVDYIQLGYQEYISIQEINNPYGQIDKEIKVDFSLLEEDFHITLKDNFATNVIGSGFNLPDGKDTSLKTLEVVYHKNGKLVGYQYLPICRRDISGKSQGPYWWELCVPDREWSERLIQYRESLFERFSLK